MTGASRLLRDVADAVRASGGDWPSGFWAVSPHPRWRRLLFWALRVRSPSQAVWTWRMPTIREAWVGRIWVALGVLLLALVGCSSAPPSPAPARTCKGPSRVDYYLHADVRFTRAERDALYQAAAQWSEIACASTIIVTFDNPHPETWREDATAGRRSLVRGVELGPADIHDHDGGATRDHMAVFVAPHPNFSRLALHEFGHLLGLEHDVDGTVMRQDVSQGSDVITDRDFDQCVSKGSCDP